jgi:membrane associated rhomboid family serine protease
MVSITYILIGVTVIISLMAWSQPKLMGSWVFSPYHIHKQNQWHRFLTSGFLHNDYMHLIFNMISLLFLGGYAEAGFSEKYGEDFYRYYFLFFYLSAIVVADIPIYFKHKNNPHYRALGASGAVSAIVFAAILMEPNIRLILYPIPLPIPGVLYAVLYVVYSAYMAKNSRDNIGHDAHLYGSLYGLVFVMIMMPEELGRFIDYFMHFLD